MPGPIMVRWNYPRMFQAAGGNPADLQRLIHKHCGHEPSLGTVQMWSSRKQISREWLASVLYALMREGHRVFDFMQVGAPKSTAAKARPQNGGGGGGKRQADIF